MYILVVYDSKFGNTERVAAAIARGMATASDVVLLSTAEAAGHSRRPDLLVLGGPTHRRGASTPMQAFVAAIPAALLGVPSACFDTRYRGPLLIMGSAAASVTKALASAGTPITAPPESFFIVRKGQMPTQELEPGELIRAEAYGHALASRLAATTAIAGHVPGTAAAPAG